MKGWRHGHWGADLLCVPVVPVELLTLRADTSSWALMAHGRSRIIAYPVSRGEMVEGGGKQQ